MKIGILVSGSGTNFAAIVESCKKGEINGEVVLMISSRSSAYALERAKAYNIPSKVVKPADFPDRESFEKEMVILLKERGVELVALAGFMRILSPFFLREFKDRVINIHPSLLPSFAGLDAQKRAFEYGTKFTGCTVHFVDEGCDTGPIIVQGVVPVLSDDDPEKLKERILKVEHRIYPLAIKLIAEGRVRIEGRRVIVTGEKEKDLEAYINY